MLHAAPASRRERKPLWRRPHLARYEACSTRSLQCRYGVPRAAFGFALVLAVLQVVLVGVSYIRVVHEDRLHLALLAPGGVFAALFCAAVMLDRDEYGADLERFDEAPHSGAHLRPSSDAP